MSMVCNGRKVDIIYVREYFAGYVDGEFVVSGDTWTEVYDDLVEMGYLN